MKIYITCISFLISWGSVFSQYKFEARIHSESLSNATMTLLIFNNVSFIPIKSYNVKIDDHNQTITGLVDQPSNMASIMTKSNGVIIDQNFVLDSGQNNLKIELPVENKKFLSLESNARGNFIFDDLNNVLEEISQKYKIPIRENGYLKISPELNIVIKQGQFQRLERYSNDYAGLLYLFRMSRMDASPFSAKNNLGVLEKFSAVVKDSPLAIQLYMESTALINGKSGAIVGNQVKKFTLKDADDNNFSNTTLKGFPYVIVFSATWCGPCQLQLPKLKKLYQTYKSKGLKLVYFNDDDDQKRWKKHINQNKLDWINVSENVKPSVSKIPKSFGVYSIPTCLVIDKNGVIVYNSDQSDPGIHNIENYIKKVVNN
jgi:cytochrome oxidase Cu insertion factor (SCO1/SenC/PrrC family)